MCHTHTHTYAKLRENPIRFQIGIQLESNFAPRIPSNRSF